MGHQVKFKDWSRMVLAGRGGGGVAGELVFIGLRGSLGEDEILEIKSSVVSSTM